MSAPFIAIHETDLRVASHGVDSVILTRGNLGNMDGPLCGFRVSDTTGATSDHDTEAAALLHGYALACSALAEAAADPEDAKTWTVDAILARIDAVRARRP